ncbi:MAG: hypothetical protein RR034_02495 [Bacteroidales bacterium]
MRSFSYRSIQSDENAALHYQKKRINVQQLVFSGIFFLILLILIVYIVDKVRFVEFDGYVHVSTVAFKIVDDAYISDVRVKVGDLVNEGDTVFEYVLINQVMDQLKVESYSNYYKDFDKLEYENKMLQSKLKILSEKDKILDYQIQKESDNIKYGLSTVEQRELLKIKQSENILEQENVVNNLEMIQYFQDKLSQKIYALGQIALPTSYTASYFSEEGKKDLNFAYRYAIARTRSIITDIRLVQGALAFKGEEILESQRVDNEMANMHIIMYVMPDQMKYLSARQTVEIYITNDMKFKGYASTRGVRVSEIPKHLQSKFMKNIEAIEVRVDFDVNSDVPFWVITNNLPVKIKVKKRF